MPPLRFRSGGSFGRLVLLVTSIVIGGLGIWTFVSLGRILHHEDPLEQADTIFVLGGTRLDRAAEAGHLYLDGWARTILLSVQYMDRAEIELRARGVAIQSLVEMQRDVLVQMGVPRDAIDAVKAEQVTTATEIHELRAQWERHRWSRIIVVTSKLHTARVRLTLGRRFEGTGVRLIVRASRYDRTDIDRWWQSREYFRDGVVEAQKMVAYWMGVAD